jgi:hypothetical protein
MRLISRHPADLNEVRFSLLCSTTLLLLACASDQPTNRAPVSTDSAGINIVTSVAPTRTIPDLTEVATLVASFGEDPRPYPLQNVAQAIRQGEGRIIFLDSRTREVTAFGPNEGFQPVARQGNGPGEVAFPAMLQRLQADSFQVYDRRLSRVSVFGPDGTLAYEVQIAAPPNGNPPSVLWRVADTLFVGLLSSFSERRELARVADVGTLGQTPVVVTRFNLRGELTDTVAHLTGYADVQTPGSSLAPAFGLSVPFAVTESGLLAFGSGEVASVTLATPEGDVQRIYRLEIARPPVHRDTLVATLSADQATARQLGAMASDNPVLESAFLPDSQPAYKDLRVYNGQVWLGSAEPFLLPSRIWNVIASDGNWLAAIGLPVDAHLLDVSGDYIVLRRTGQLDVQRVEVYRLSESIGGA